MVISFYGALNAFLAMYDLLPESLRRFILLSLMLGAGLFILIKVSDL